jgi:hypothetical protein
MSREVFYGISSALSNQAQNYYDRMDIHWTSDDGHTTMDLWRSNFALQLAHSIDAIYYSNVITKLLDDDDNVRIASYDAIQQKCSLPAADRRWLSCPIPKKPQKNAIFVGGAAAWEPRAYAGLYGYYANEVSCCHLLII